jgi:hypothetical protein
VREGGEVARLAPTYLPREPHATVLYRLVKEHGAEFLRHARESYDGPLPRYVEDELRGYLRCGDFSRGFVHLRCPRCQHDLLVPFSCKNRGLCPSCAGRRMAAQAAHLVDCILPAVPIRQFVLSFPFELSLLAATKPEVLRALARIHAEELARHYKQAAKKSGESGKDHAGAFTYEQRFGSRRCRCFWFTRMSVSSGFKTGCSTDWPASSPILDRCIPGCCRHSFRRAWLTGRSLLRATPTSLPRRGCLGEHASVSVLAARAA